jgi:putative nucleotidyltransferase with HDIG domain
MSTTAVNAPSLKDEKINRILKEVKAFPGMPTTAAKLMPLLHDPEASTARIEEIVKYDPGLTANLLKLCNSAYFGLPSHVSSVRQAIMLLGWKRLLQLVMTMCMSALMKKPISGYDLPQGELWRHSVAASVGADVLVKSLGLGSADEVFTAALLHDVGKIVLGEFVQQELAAIQEMVAKGITFEVAEFIVIGTNHAEVGARILKAWALPGELVNAVSWHHDPEKCADACLVSDVVHVANLLGILAGYGKAEAGTSLEPCFDVADRLGLNQAGIEKLAERTRQEVQKLADILS